MHVQWQIQALIAIIDFVAKGKKLTQKETFENIKISWLITHSS